MEILSGRFTGYIPKENSGGGEHRRTGRSVSSAEDKDLQKVRSISEERKAPDICGPGKASREYGGWETFDPLNKRDTAGICGTPGGQTQNGQAAGGLQAVQQIQDSEGLKEILGLQTAEEYTNDPAAMLKEHLKKAKEAKLGKTSKPQDSSGSLTRRLVSARRQLAVRQVLAEASSNLAGLRMIASFGSEEDAAFARACIKRLEKLIRRAGRKIRALDGEDRMRVREKQAELVRQKDRATEIREQLRKQKVLRHMRENGYLLEELHEQILGNLRRGESGSNGGNNAGGSNGTSYSPGYAPGNGNGPFLADGTAGIAPNSGAVRLSGAEEAAIARQAEAMASQEAVSGTLGGSGETGLTDNSAAGLSQPGSGSGSGDAGGTGRPAGGLNIVI